jgi:hypothetical protein
VKTAKQLPLGTRAWEVEWCDRCDKDEGGDTDLDSAHYITRIFISRDAADAYAEKVFPVDVFGCVAITPVELTDPYGDDIHSTFIWEACGESYWYEGEE